MPSSRYYRFKMHTSEEKNKRREIILFWFFFVAASLFIAWAFFFSPFFKITEIKLPENDFVTDNDIRKIIIGSKFLDLGENLFVLSKNRIKSDLAATFPDLTNINIKKEFFHSLIINFEERIQIGIWCQLQADNCYYFDKEGIVFKKAPQTEGFLILKIQ
ncbi:MAG: FtsQ-type POTRA domain-containing protein, partial [Candidatus Azambacteria bacterium]|nr:FtsQ-type POTRA domain-containing protein [Candidatus Azambacteria bacterium]